METKTIHKKNFSIRNGGHLNGSAFNSNQNNNNTRTMHENFDEIRPETTPDGYGLRTPYGTHLNLDFLKYCENIAQPQQNITNFRRQRNDSASSRHMRLSMNVPSCESLDSIASEVSNESASDLADHTLMETRRRLEAYRSFRTKRKPPPQQSPNHDVTTPKQMISPTEKGCTTPIWASKKALPVGDMLSSINALPPEKYKHVREQLVSALHRLRDLENEVKKVPVLQLQVSSLRGEKVELINTVKKLRETNNVPGTKTVPIMPTGVPPIPPKRKYRSIGCHTSPETVESRCQANISPTGVSQSVQCAVTTCHATSNTQAIEQNAVSVQANIGKDTSDQCMQYQYQAQTSDFCGNTPMVECTSISTQFNPVVPAMCDSSSQSTVQSKCASSSTDRIETCDSSMMHTPDTKTTCTNTDAVQKPSHVDQSTATVKTELVDKSTEAGAKTCDSNVGNHTVTMSTLSGPDYQVCRKVIENHSQTESYEVQTQDSCVGNHVEHTSKSVGVEISTQEVSTSAVVDHRDMCVGKSVVVQHNETQSLSIDCVDVGILATQPRVITADVSSGIDYVIQYENESVQCTPLLTDVTTQAVTSVTSIDTITDPSMLGGKWVLDKTLHEKSTSAIVDTTCVETNTLPLKTCEKSSTAKPINSDAPIQVSIPTTTASSQYEVPNPLPHTTDESGDYLTIDKHSTPSKGVNVSTDTQDLGEQSKSHSELEQYVEKVSSLLEEQQNLLVSKYGEFDEESEEESTPPKRTVVTEVMAPSNAVIFKKFVPSEPTPPVAGIDSPDVFKETTTPPPASSPIKSIMRKPGSVSAETKTLRFAEGVKSDDSDTSSDEEDSDTSSETNSSSEEPDSDSPISEDSEKIDKTSENEAQEIMEPIVNPATVELELSRPTPTTEVIINPIEIEPEPQVSCITDLFLHACDVMDRHMKNPWSVTKEEVNTAQKYLEEQWTSVACQKTSSSYQVEEFVDKLSEISCNLIMKVVNLTDPNGNTALHFAISHENVPVVSTLLEIDELNVDKYNKVGYTPTMLASIMKNDSDHWFKVLNKLYQRADVNAHAKQGGETALMLVAMSHGRVKWVDALLNAGASVNAQDNDGSTALMCAVEQKQMDFVKRLLAHPSTNLNIKDHNGDTAYDIAMTKDIAIGLLLYAKQNFGKAPRSNKHRQKIVTKQATS